MSTIDEKLAADHTQWSSAVIDHGKPQVEEAAFPWRNITDEWNAALEDFRKRTGKHWHSTLRGSRGRDFRHGHDRKRCAILVVVDSFQGKPIDLRWWSGYPDYWDLKRIIAQPLDAVFRGVKRGGCVAIADSLSEHVQRIVDLHNASILTAVSAEVRP